MRVPRKSPHIHVRVFKGKLASAGSVASDPRGRGQRRTDWTRAAGCGIARGTVLSDYLPILMFLFVAVVIACALLVIGWLLGPKRASADKLSPYECGFEAFEDARMKFDVRYYLVAILFIIFDLEIAFLFPWAVVFKDIGLTAIVAMAIFLGILVIGFVYEWKKGALEWE
jgi:NADH-quinone oxidoreductase subunit A